ncbi:MAG TPA: hypothetical protein VNH64_11400, partial [Parvularculaceae bacterium]|nr:hypothetical protein [Parvularculaceae bacterium]
MIARAAIAVLAGGLFLSALAHGADAPGQRLRDQITEAHWLAPGVDVAAFLSSSPGECVRAPENADEAWLVEVGRAAFRSPLLFGGSAARTGLSCNVCHRDGRDNPAFYLSGFSSAPGTADVTSSVFSKKREDGVANAVKIPTLVGAAGKTSFGTVAPHPSLASFIHDAVEDEFQGAPPPQVVLDGLAAYVSHLDAAACPAGPRKRSAPGDMNDALRALAAARIALARGDAATADFLIVSAQRVLGAVDERYPGSRLGEDR